MTVVALAIVVGLVVFVLLGTGLFLLLIKLGVIVREAARPPHLDNQNYTLRQGREVGKSDQPRSGDEARR